MIGLRLASSERAVGTVPRWVIAGLAAALALQVGWQISRGKPIAQAAALSSPPKVTALRVASAGEPITASQMLVLYLQAFDNQPGVSIPFLALDYAKVSDWLAVSLQLDPRGQYPLMMASQLYSQVPDEPKQRMMLELVHREFMLDPDRRWRWLAHAAIMAKHRLNDMPLALRYAHDITRHARGASNWARQMSVFILEDMGEAESAAVLLGGLLHSGEVTEPREFRFLSERLEQLKSAGNSSSTSKNRQPAP